MRGYSVVIDWQSNKLTWRTARMRVVATTEDEATEVALGKLKKRKDFNRYIQISTLCDI
jgi:hypothetical protein